jgi:hypothetical protein
MQRGARAPGIVIEQQAIIDFQRLGKGLVNVGTGV